jgi:hypothetical protein
MYGSSYATNIYAIGDILAGGGIITATVSDEIDTNDSIQEPVIHYGTVGKVVVEVL